MLVANKITQVLFGFQDEATGAKLSEFFNKHTGKNVDFNSVKHYKSGFKLLLFSIPLDTFTQAGITAAVYAPSNFKKFTCLDDFIKWYEGPYYERIREIEKLQSKILKICLVMSQQVIEF